MTPHPAIQPGRTAVITGGASGIGLAAAKRLAGLGMDVLVADANEASLAEARAAMAEAAPGARVEFAHTDVSDFAQVSALKDTAFSSFGDVAVLMNNAGVGRGGHAFENPDGWRRVIETNLFGVLNGVQAFTQLMIDQGKPAVIINTGSKQGITCPPGDTAYNASKAGIKVLTEGLQHTLRGTPGCQVSAHLLVPGSTFTGMTARRGGEKPPGAWTADQVVEFMLERLAAGDFYILCPDNDVTREMDNARMEWAMGDLIQNRPPLSRWHADYKDAFAAFMAGKLGDG
ncbi:MAG: SDR family NAD(P)-dependent oxidoreductase [Caulobacterales bacterium]